MPRQKGAVVTNSFVNGLVTEATALNFPENAVTETYNCVFERTGKVRRRVDIDFEEGYETKTVDRTNVAMKGYFWPSPSGISNLQFYVEQVGDDLHFWKVEDVETLSTGEMVSTINLLSFKSGDGNGDNPTLIECDFDSGKGYLFVTHPHLTPFRVSYDADLETFTGTAINIQVRDFATIESGIEDTERILIPLVSIATAPAYIESTYPEHYYNLFNRGWWEQDGAYIQKIVTGNTQVASDNLFNTTYSAPSLCDIWWLFKDATELVVAKNFVNNTQGSTPAVAGRYVVDPFNIDRSTISGIAGLDVEAIGYDRPSTVSFFAGRVWYGGIDYFGFSNKLYFSQIITEEEEFDKCYQKNDPTSENKSDLLPTDGGVISIIDCELIVKMFPMENGLVVFGTNGVWFISGSTGIGFTANDYSIKKIGNIPCISRSSFVSLQGIPSWWNIEGIYTVTQGQTGTLGVVSMTDQKIRSFYQDIPSTAKFRARGAFDPIFRNIYWLYKSVNDGDLTKQYEFDRVLVFNTLTGAFYPFTLPSISDVRVHDIVSIQPATTITTLSEVYDSSGALVTDYLFAQVYSEQTTTVPLNNRFKFLCSYRSGSTWELTFAEENQNEQPTYLDFYSYDDAGESYSSYFVTGHRVHGDAQRKYQPNYIFLYFEDEQPSVIDFQSQWDYAISQSSNRWSSLQRLSTIEPVTNSSGVTVTDANGDTVYILGKFSNKMKKVRVRGHGYSCQFKFESVDSEPFYIIGWSAWESANSDI
jgi:hypothetical protein